MDRCFGTSAYAVAIFNTNCTSPVCWSCTECPSFAVGDRQPLSVMVHHFVRDNT